MVLHPIKPEGHLGFGFLREEIERERGLLGKKGS